MLVIPKVGDLIILKKCISGRLYLPLDHQYDDENKIELNITPTFFMPNSILMILDIKLSNQKNEYYVLIIRFMFASQIFISNIIIHKDEKVTIYELID